MDFVKFMAEVEGFWGIEDYFVEAQGKTLGGDKSARLNLLMQDALSCQACSLYKTRNRLVFGEGSADADLMFIGEAPGADEDRQGRPFVGRAGQLLTRLIDKMGFDRADVYIANVLKCRPPGNRNPLPSEIFACRHFLLEQIDIIRPRVICTLGKFATELLLERKIGIKSARGRVFDFKGIKVVPTFHPAYLLRNPRDKILVWEDAKTILRILGKEINE